MILQIPNCIHWTAPVCHTARLKMVCININRCINLFLFPCWNCTVFFMFICCVTLATCRFKLPAGPPGSPVQHVTDVTGVQSAGAGPQSAGQLIRQLSTACHFQCYGQQAECAGMAAASSVAIGTNFLEQLYCKYFMLKIPLVTVKFFSCLIHKNLRSTMYG